MHIYIYIYIYLFIYVHNPPARRGLETSKSFMRFCKAPTLASTSSHKVQLDVLGNSAVRNPLQCPSEQTCPFRSRTSKAVALSEGACTPTYSDSHPGPGSRNSDLVLVRDYHLDARPGQNRAPCQELGPASDLQLSSGLVFSPIIHSMLG